MATGGNVAGNEIPSPGMDNSLKENALSLLNFFQCDLAQASESVDRVCENQNNESGQEESENCNHGNPIVVQEVRNNSRPEQENVGENQDGAIRQEESGNGNPSVQEVGDNSGPEQENVGENQDGAIRQEESGNGNPSVQEVGDNSEPEQENVGENQDGAIRQEESGNGNPSVQEVGDNSGPEQENVGENQDGAIRQEESGNGSPRVQEVEDNSRNNQGNDGENQDPTNGPRHVAQQAQPLTKASIQKIIHNAVGVLVKAVEEEARNSTFEAFRLYKRGLELLMVVYKEPTLETRIKGTLRSKINLFLTKAEHLKEHLEKNKNSDDCTVCGPNKSISTEEIETNNYFENFIMEKGFKLEEVKGQAETLESLKECLILPLKFPQLFIGRYSSSRCNSLLFGHPGTGKTMMMSAIAAELPTFNFIKLSVWDLTSRFLSDTPERGVKEMFRFFYNKSPCVLILEDLDVIDRQYANDKDNQKWRQIITELLVQYEGFNKDERTRQNKLAMVFTTQKPWCISSHFRRRLYKRIFFDLPSKQARIEILKAGLSGVRHNLTADNFDQLGDRTISARSCRYTQADLVCLCRDAMMQPVRKIQEAKYFKQVPHPDTEEEGFWIPCNQGDVGATEMSWTNLDVQKLLEPGVEMSDFLEILKKSGGTVDSETEARMQQWVGDFT